jgi:Na+/H+ antiporter NhaC
MKLEAQAIDLLDTEKMIWDNIAWAIDKYKASAQIDESRLYTYRRVNIYITYRLLFKFIVVITCYTH